MTNEILLNLWKGLDKLYSQDLNELPSFALWIFFLGNVAYKNNHFDEVSINLPNYFCAYKIELEDSVEWCLVILAYCDIPSPISV